MKVAELLSNIQSLTNYIVADGVLIDYINALEAKMFTETIYELRVKWIDVKKDDKNIFLGAFKFEIDSLEIYDNIDGNRINTYSFVDSDDRDIYSDSDVVVDEYAIKNKWGKCAIKLIYRYVPKAKSLDSCHEDSLDIMRYGRQWIELYEHYLKNKIYFSVEEYTQANNETIYFNEALASFRKYYLDHYHNRTVKKVEGVWRS